MLSRGAGQVNEDSKVAVSLSPHDTTVPTRHRFSECAVTLSAATALVFYWTLRRGRCAGRLALKSGLAVPGPGPEPGGSSARAWLLLPRLSTRSSYSQLGSGLQPGAPAATTGLGWLQP